MYTACMREIVAGQWALVLGLPDPLPLLLVLPMSTCVSGRDSVSGRVAGAGVAAVGFSVTGEGQKTSSMLS